ncbi:histidine kinase [Desulfofundulus salinus]|uniref:Histidine kinase n=1 Tax=Desulfofundulus salinus TaxID=2419843 RepID=A0A494WZI2_9FIRM|nr:histidine kinase [Desulfofundulus salinum]RKO66285.1 histidine kinase [Desulfofundulus salinum]
MGNGDLKEEIARLEEEIAELKRRWPAHSVKPAMVEQLEGLEEKLEHLRRMEEREL